jgi:hypothetical protein
MFDFIIILVAAFAAARHGFGGCIASDRGVGGRKKV